MPQDKDFKRIVRRRMASTGEPYTAARAALDPSRRRGSEARLLTALADPARAHAAFAALKALPEARLRTAALVGMDHASWRVRRSCCRLLDDLSLTPESTSALELRLADPHPLVRKSALHTLTCKHCKPDGCVLDVGSLLQRMAADPNRRVRMGIVHGLSWAWIDEPWMLPLLRRFAQRDPSAQLREVARHTIAQFEQRRQSNQLR